MEQLIGPVLDAGPAVVYVAVGVLAFCEAAVFVGLVVPGGVVAALAGVLAAQGRVSLTTVVLVAVAGAIAGDSVSYEIGRRWGPRLLRLRALRRHAAKVRWAQAWLHRRGEVVVLLSRWTGVVGTLVPSVAGMARMPYGRFLAANVVGGIGWGVLYPVLGYATGESFHVVEGWLGGVSWMLAGLVALAIAGHAIAVRVRRARMRRTRKAAGAGGCPAAAPDGRDAEAAPRSGGSVAAAPDERDAEAAPRSGGSVAAAAVDRVAS